MISWPETISANIAIDKNNTVETITISAQYQMPPIAIVSTVSAIIDIIIDTATTGIMATVRIDAIPVKYALFLLIGKACII